MGIPGDLNTTGHNYLGESVLKKRNKYLHLHLRQSVAELLKSCSRRFRPTQLQACSECNAQRHFNTC